MLLPAHDAGLVQPEEGAVAVLPVLGVALDDWPDFFDQPGLFVFFEWTERRRGFHDLLYLLLVFQTDDRERDAGKTQRVSEAEIAALEASVAETFHRNDAHVLLPSGREQRDLRAGDQPISHSQRAERRIEFVLVQHPGK